jgi:hypothetical protein
VFFAPDGKEKPPDPGSGTGGTMVAGCDYLRHRPEPWFLLYDRAATTTSPRGERRSGSIVASHNMICLLPGVFVGVFV